MAPRESLVSRDRPVPVSEWFWLLALVLAIIMSPMLFDLAIAAGLTN
jgi:hypothetical protein